MPMELEPIEEAKQEEAALEKVPPNRKRGRPPGSKNKVKKPVLQQLPQEEVPEQQPQQEEVPQQPQPPSPRTQKRMYLQQMAKAQAELHERKMQYFANMLSRTLPY